MTTYALISAIEGTGKNLNEQKGIVKQKRMFEEEAILCATNWRKNGGWLKNIPIYFFCPTDNGISDLTKKALASLGVTYIEELQPITQSFTSGFLNSPLVGHILEGRLTEDMLVKIDLDMNLIKPLPESWFDEKVTIVGQYDDYCTKQQRIMREGWANPSDTGLVISNRARRFYYFWFMTVKGLLDNPESDPDWLHVREQTGEYYLEEYAVDKMFRDGRIPIKPMQKYQIGEWYTPVKELTDEELNEVYFWHEHIIHDTEYDKFREKIEYTKRMKKIK